MKKLFGIIFSLSTATMLSGQMVQPIPDIIRDMSLVTIVQDSTISQLMIDKKEGVIRGIKEMSGFRVQIYSDNTPVHAKTTAIQLEERLSKLINEPIYIISTPPFFKVRIGDFKTQLEASTYKEAFIRNFPEMAGETYVVRDEHIHVKQ